MPLTIASLLCLGVTIALAQSEPPPIWKGIYSAAQPREGPRPMRTGMAAEVVGCLIEGVGSWQVTDATEPVASAVDLFESDLKAAAAAPLGTRTFQLL